jgi:hypothetical protein
MQSNNTTTTSASRGQIKLAPAAVQKQIQSALSVYCMMWVYSLDQMKLAQVHKKLFDRYHGNPESGTIAAVGNCFSPSDAFAFLWERVDENASYSLKHCLLQKDDTIYSLGTSFTKASISSAKQSSSVLIDGRAIYTLAMTALKNGKKALSIEKSVYKDGKLPSGWSDDDLDEFILDGMWRMLKVSGTEPESPVDANDKVEVEDATDEDSTRAPEIFERPEEWIFPGWVAYHTFGPRAHDAYESPLFEVGDWVKNKRSASGSGGREEQWRALAEQTNTIRTNSLDHGVALGATKKDMVIIAQAENGAEQ